MKTCLIEAIETVSAAGSRGVLSLIPEASSVGGLLPEQAAAGETYGLPIVISPHFYA